MDTRFALARGSKALASPGGVDAVRHGFLAAPVGDVVMLEGFDAGVRFRSLHDPGRSLTATMISNTSPGRWPLTKDIARPLCEL